MDKAISSDEEPCDSVFEKVHFSQKFEIDSGNEPYENQNLTFADRVRSVIRHDSKDDGDPLL